MKQDFTLEPYLTVVEIKKFRKALSKFRLSNTNLLIELGRHINLPVEDRVCEYCKKNGINKVENELHVFSCKRYSDIRQLYIGNLVPDDANIYEIVSVFRNDEENVIKSLAMFIFYMLHKQRELL